MLRDTSYSAPPAAAQEEEGRIVMQKGQASPTSAKPIVATAATEVGARTHSLKLWQVSEEDQAALLSRIREIERETEQRISARAREALSGLVAQLNL